MPGFDGTGPSGLGPRTGRGMGPCGRGLGFRRGYGRGMGFGRGLVVDLAGSLAMTHIRQALQRKVS